MKIKSIKAFAITNPTMGGAYSVRKENEGLLRRLARESGGKYVRAADAEQIISELRSGAPRTTEPERRDLWHEPWAFALVIALLSGEWMLRRRWGLR